MEKSGLDLMGREKDESVFCPEEENHPQLWDNIEESKNIISINRRNFPLKRSILKGFLCLLCVESSSSLGDA